MKIEFALLYEDRTWSTEVVEVPFDEDTLLTEVEEWAQMELLEERLFGEAIRVYIYNDAPEDGGGA